MYLNKKRPQLSTRLLSIWGIEKAKKVLRWFLLQVNPLAFLLGLFLLACLTACNQPTGTQPIATMNVTQAYQTVAANLTAAVTRTPQTTASPIPTDSGLTIPTPTTTQTVPATQDPITPSPEIACDVAAAGNPIDVTIPDDTQFKPGEPFTKIWQLVNVGTCTWTGDYAAVWFSGEMMSAPSSASIGVSVAPGEAVEIAVDMIAPTQPGTYQSNWKFRNEAGLLFGIGPLGDSPYWVRIIVVSTATSTPEDTPEPTITPTLSPTPVVQVSGIASLLSDSQLDLDANLVGVSPDADIQFHSEDQTSYFLTALEGGLLGVFGNTQPTLDDCQNANLSTASLPLDSLIIGSTHLCYRTDQGRYGWARLDSFDSDKSTLVVEILTWALP
jgi:hypothetical protein